MCKDTHSFRNGQKIFAGYLYEEGVNKKKTPCFGASLLSYLDSNQDKLIQSQMCYRYTIGQSVFSL